MEETDDNREEQCYYHTLQLDYGGTSYAIRKDDLGIAIKVSYDGRNLPSITQWISIRSGEYVLGPELGAYEVGGRKEEREKNDLQCIEPGEIKVIG